MIRVMVPARGMPRLIITGPEAKKAHKALELVLGVEWRGDHLVLPAEPRLFELLQSFGAQPDSSAQTWYEQTTKPEIARMQWLAQEDCESRHPAGPLLFPFQRVGAEFIARTGSTLLCDETGLGKTLTTIVGVESSPQHGRVLVVCLNTLKLWWKTEYYRWSVEQLPVTVLESPTRDAQMAMFTTGWLIVNYKQLLIVPRLRKFDWDWIVFDEGHTLCNRRTQTYEAAEALSCRSRLVVTATPYGNNPAEVWALLHLIAPGRYGSYWRFYELYVRYQENYFGGREILGVKNEGLLRRGLAPVMIRRRKIDVYPQLPEKVYQTIPLRMEEAQAKIYRTAAKEMYIQLPEDEVLEIRSTIAKITRLRQILSTPTVFGLEDTSTKLDYIVEFLSNHEGKVVIFSLFRCTVEAVKLRLDCIHVSSTLVWGGMTSEEAEASRQRFITGEARVLIGTIAGAGAGLNLREAGAEVAIFVDRHWNPARQAQCEDRIHGIGQMGKVLVQSLHCLGTVDDLVEKILTRKMVMTEAVLGEALRKELQRWV